MTIDTGGPGLPELSATRPKSTVSPVENPSRWLTCKQYCRPLLGRDDTVASFPSGPSVHGSLGSFTSNRQARSTMASTLSAPKSGVENPGTPPPPCCTGCLSHTATEPLPKERSATICKLG